MKEEGQRPTAQEQSLQVLAARLSASFVTAPDLPLCGGPGNSQGPGRYQQPIVAAALKQQVLEEPHPYFLMLLNFIFFGSFILHMKKSKAQGWQIRLCDKDLCHTNLAT